ncbi:MAG: contact-dependent growth inhibition system immunity protein [Planctomycetaceae bacterium]|nr:hypothetical protein [Planctomycetaceae bacterium]
MTNTVTFRQLEFASSSSKPAAGDSALDEWYRRVRDIPINELDDGDLCRACRQQVYLDHVVPIAVERLTVQPLAGEMYDGELLVAMKSIPTGYWQRNSRISQDLADVVKKVHVLSEDDDILADADEVGRRIRAES